MEKSWGFRLSVCLSRRWVEAARALRPGLISTQQQLQSSALSLTKGTLGTNQDAKLPFAFKIDFQICSLKQKTIRLELCVYQSDWQTGICWENRLFCLKENKVLVFEVNQKTNNLDRWGISIPLCGSVFLVISMDTIIRIWKQKLDTDVFLARRLKRNNGMK